MTSARRAWAIHRLVFCICLASLAMAQDIPTQTMRPVIRGRQAAVASMKAEATEAARRILAEGGNAFDAIVGGQAALAVTDFPLNGVGSDAVILAYVAREKKVVSINAEPRGRSLPPSIGMRRITAVSFRTATDCSPAAFPGSSTRGTFCWTAGAP